MESESLEDALALLRAKFREHRDIGQDQFFGLRRRVVRKDHARSKLCSLVEWFNALGGERGRLICVPLAEEDAVVMVLHGELAKLRAAVPFVPKAPRVPLRRGAVAG